MLPSRCMPEFGLDSFCLLAEINTAHTSKCCSSLKFTHLHIGLEGLEKFEKVERIFLVHRAP